MRQMAGRICLTSPSQVRYIYDYGHLEEKKEVGKNCFSVFLVDVTDKIK